MHQWKWTKDKIISVIRWRYRNDRELSCLWMERNCVILWGIADFYFGSWKDAIIAAGLDYNEVRKQPKWSKEILIEEIQRLYTEGCDLSHTHMQDIKSRVYYSAVDIFGSWKKALQAAGINSEDFHVREKWSVEKVINRIKKRRAAGKDLNWMALFEDDYALLKAAEKRFDKWDDALEMAGLDPLEIRLRAPAGS